MGAAGVVVAGVVVGAAAGPVAGGAGVAAGPVAGGAGVDGVCGVAGACGAVGADSLPVVDGVELGLVGDWGCSVGLADCPACRPPGCVGHGVVQRHFELSSGGQMTLLHIGGLPPVVGLQNLTSETRKTFSPKFGWPGVSQMVPAPMHLIRGN